MFETRTLDIGPYSLYHIVRVNNIYVEEYSCMYEGKKCALLIAITPVQKRNLQHIIAGNSAEIQELFFDNTIKLPGFDIRYVMAFYKGEYASVLELFADIELETELFTVRKSDTRMNDAISFQSYLDFSYNRMDYNFLNYEMIEISTKEERMLVPYSVGDDKIFLGASVIPISTEMLAEIIMWLQNHYASIHKIEVMFSLAYDKRLAARNNFAVNLPSSYEELLLRVKKKTAGNVRREWGYFEREVGKVECIHYSKKQIQDAHVNQYFDMKLETHGCNYHMSAGEYLKKYYVTDAYTLEHEGEISAILFSCEQSQIAYLENFSYDKKYERFSLGTLLYWKYLEQLIFHKKTALYLAGGSYQYKKHFKSVNMLCFSGEIEI